MLAVVVEVFPDRGGPHPGDDFQLLGEQSEALLGEGQPVGGVLLGEPARSQSQLHPAAGHVVHLGDLHGQHPRCPEGRRGHQGPEPDRRGLPRDPGQRGPRLGGPGQRVAPAHPEEVVGAEEAGEAERLGTTGDGELVGVGGTLLGFDEDSKVHPPSLPGMGAPAGSWRGQGAVMDESRLPRVSVTTGISPPPGGGTGARPLDG